MKIRAKLFSFIICIFGILAHVSNANEIKQIQTLLSELGYNPGPLDGVYGSKTQASLQNYYFDRNKVYDGKPDANELADLQSTVAQHHHSENSVGAANAVLPVTYFRSKFVDYSKSYDYKRDWVDWDAYGKLILEKADSHPYYSNYDISYHTTLMSKCEYMLFKNPDNMYFHKHENSNSFGRPLVECISQNTNLMLQEVVNFGKDSPRLKWFYEQLIPKLASGKYWLTGGFHEYATWDHGVPVEYEIRNQNYNMNHARVMWYLAEDYAWFKNYYGTTPEQDQQFIDWWEAHEISMRPSILDQEFTTGCIGYGLIPKARNEKHRNGDPAAVGMQEWNKLTSSCDNYAAEYARILVLMGAGFENSDYINEGLHLIANVLRSAGNDGVTLDAFRCEEGLGYPWMTAAAIAQAGFVLENSVGIDITSHKFESANTTVDKILQRVLDVTEDRSLGIDDAWLLCGNWASTDTLESKSQLMTLNYGARDHSSSIYESAWWINKSNQSEKYHSLLYPNRYLQPFGRGYDYVTLVDISQ